MAYTPEHQPMFFDINDLISERDRMKDLKHRRVKFKEHVNQKRVKKSENMYLLNNKLFHFTFNEALIARPVVQHETFEPNVKRRKIQTEDFTEENDFEIVEMDVEAAPNCPETLLPSDLEVVSSVPPEIILEPSTSNDYLQVADVRNKFTFDPSWQPTIPELISTSIKSEINEDIQFLEMPPKNFQAPSGYFDKYKTCFKRRSDLRMKDAVDIDEEDISFDHPRLKNVTTHLGKLRMKDNLQHWTMLRNQFRGEGNQFSSQPLMNNPETLPPNMYYNFNQDANIHYFQTPSEFFNQDTSRNDQLYEYVKLL